MSKHHIPTEIMTFDQRKSKAEYIMKKYPDRIPIIVRCHIATKKLIVPRAITVSDILKILKRRVGCYQFMIGDILPLASPSPSPCLIGELYDLHKAEDDILYLVAVPN